MIDPVNNEVQRNDVLVFDRQTLSTDQGTRLGVHLSREIISITDIKIKENVRLKKVSSIEVPVGRFRPDKTTDH